MSEFILYRILGNDLPPCHGLGQTLSNLQFILEHEPSLAGCEKRWVVNRIVDSEQEAKILALLDKYGQRYLHLPFLLEEYSQFRYDIECLPKIIFHHSPGNQRFPPLLRARALEYPFRHKNLYAMNNNGTRNAALEEGRFLAEWVMPWDGNCFLTKPAWDSILLAVESLQNKKYLITPMAKVKHNLDLLDSRFSPNPTGEPQIAFRRDAQERFDDLKRYGFNPKVELLRRLRVPGPWDNWPVVPWEQQETNDAKGAGEFHFAGWVARLSYGISESKNVPSLIPLARINGIVRMLSSLDERVLREKFRQDDLVYYDESVLAASKLAWKCGEIGVDAVINKLIGTAESLLKVRDTHE